MDEFQTDNVDLLNFINKKRDDKPNTEPKKIFFLFTKKFKKCCYSVPMNNKIVSILSHVLI